MKAPFSTSVTVIGLAPVPDASPVEPGPLLTMSTVKDALCWLWSKVPVSGTVTDTAGGVSTKFRHQPFCAPAGELCRSWSKYRLQVPFGFVLANAELNVELPRVPA